MSAGTRGGRSFLRVLGYPCISGPWQRLFPAKAGRGAWGQQPHHVARLKFPQALGRCHRATTHCTESPSVLKLDTRVHTHGNSGTEPLAASYLEKAGWGGAPSETPATRCPMPSDMGMSPCGGSGPKTSSNHSPSATSSGWLTLVRPHRGQCPSVRGSRFLGQSSS